MDNSRILINLGCGQTRPVGWINTDSSLNSLAQKCALTSWITKYYKNLTVYESINADYMDLRKKWEFEDKSVDVVYASHVFEHLPISSSKFFMSEAYRVLKLGGIVRIVVPDLYKLAKNYIIDYEQGQENASQQFLYALNLHQEGAYPYKNNIVVRFANFLQGHPHQHKYMYDAMSLKKIFQDYGFEKLYESRYGESQYIPEITQVECTSEGVSSIYIEAIKIS